MAKKTTPKPRTPTHHGDQTPHTRPHHRRHPHTHEELVELVIALEAQIMALSQTITAALDAQDQKIADLGHKVDDFIATHQGNAADDQAIVDRLAKQGASVDAIAAKLV